MTFLFADVDAVIFDMDGLLLDTERLSLDMFMQACERCDCVPNRDVYLACIGSDGGKTKQILREGHDKDFPLEAVCDIWSRDYRRAILEEPIAVKKGAKDLLEFLSSENVKMAVATSTKQEMAAKKLMNVNFDHFFKIVVGGDQVSKGKPDPEIYQKAAARLQVPPAKCLAFEDSNTGVKAAYHAGMNVIQVPDLLEVSSEVKAFKHRIVNSLDDVSMLLREKIMSENA